MDNIIKNYEEILEKPPSTRIFLKFLKHKLDVKRKFKKVVVKEEEQSLNNPPEGIEISSLALVVDGVVLDIMRVQKEFGDILQKNPTFILINPESHVPHQGWIYEDGLFFPMEDILKKSQATIRG